MLKHKEENVSSGAINKRNIQVWIPRTVGTIEGIIIKYVVSSYPMFTTSFHWPSE